MNRCIGWERWVDFDDDELDELDEVEGPEEEETEEDGKTFNFIPMLVRTPLGQYNPYESMAPTKMFDCWICHTNFDISDCEHVLNNIEGIEVLKVMTRYRIFIGIGKMFSLTDVRPKVELCLEITNPSLISKFVEEISGKERWAIFLYENGSHKIVTSLSKEGEEFDAEVTILRNTDPVNIITSEDF